MSTLDNPFVAIHSISLHRDISCYMGPQPIGFFADKHFLCGDFVKKFFGIRAKRIIVQVSRKKFSGAKRFYVVETRWFLNGSQILIWNTSPYFVGCNGEMFVNAEKYLRNIYPDLKNKKSATEIWVKVSKE